MLHSFYCESREFYFISNFFFRNIYQDVPGDNSQGATFREDGGVEWNIICVKSFLHESQSRWRICLKTNFTIGRIFGWDRIYICITTRITEIILRESVGLRKIFGGRGIFGFSGLPEFIVLVFCFSLEMIMDEVVWVGSRSTEEEVCDTFSEKELDVVV